MCRIKEDKALITLEFSGRHDKNSHKGLGSGRISESQKKALETVVRTNPQSRARSVHRTTQNMAEDEKIPPEMMNSVRNNVRELRRKVYSERLGMEIKGTYQDSEASQKVAILLRLSKHTMILRFLLVCMTFMF